MCNKSRLSAIAVFWCLAVWLGACSRLLEVDLPGNVESSELDSPQLAATLAHGAQSDFECAFGAWMLITSLWTSTLDQAATLTTHGNLQARRQAVDEYGTATCNVDGSPLPFGFWGPLNISRVQGAEAVRRILSHGSAIPDADFLIGKARAYEGYSIQLLAESFCELYFDIGPRLSRSDGFNLAVRRFDEAITRLASVTTGPNAAEATSILNMARVGRARANLHLGNRAAVVADASQVAPNFVRSVNRSGLNSFRYNQVFNRSQEGRAYSVGNTESVYREVLRDGFWTLTVQGVPDPRVRSRFDGLGNNQFTPLYSQQKYTSRTAPIPFATWKEARLMIAEVEGGQTAVGIINQLRDFHSLPRFASTDPTAIRNQVLEERRRELWLQGTRMGDMLRLGIPFPRGTTPAGESIVTDTPLCFPTMQAERLGNPNVG